MVITFGLPATVYIATRLVDEGIAFPDDGTPLSWAALADALSTGLVTVGSHTHSHAILDRSTPTEAAAEIDRSRGLIAERLGVAADHFACPKAVIARGPVEAVVRDRSSTAALAGTRPNRPGRTDLHRLARSPVQVADGMRWFRRKAAGGMALEGWLRARLNRFRYAGAVS